jgi:hypothetical protein
VGAGGADRLLNTVTEHPLHATSATRDASNSRRPDPVAVLTRATLGHSAGPRTAFGSGQDGNVGQGGASAAIER